MHSSAASTDYNCDFDGVALARLLNASFALWCVTATAAPGSGTALAAQVRCADGRELQVSRIDDGGRGLPVWCYGPIDLPIVAAPRAVSLVALLAELRMELDRQYAPYPLVMGARQSPAS